MNAGKSIDAPASRRARLWELDEKFHCPVVGTCLSIEQLRKLARRAGVSEAAASDYEVHVTAVSHCKDRNPLSRLLHRALEERHALWVRRFDEAKTEQAALDLWKKALAEGEAAGALWGVLTCRAATPGLRQTAFEDIHMLSHQVGAGVRADLKRVAALEREILDLKGEIERARRRHEAQLEARDARILSLALSLEAARASAAEVREFERRIAELSSGPVLKDLQRRAAQAEQRAAHFEQQARRAALLAQRLAEAEADKERLASALAHAEAEREALESWVLAEYQEGAAPCARPNLTGRRLLCVGGRLNLYSQYRALVDRAGGALDIHDGGREEATSRLPHLLARADGVICPADCVNHSVYCEVKRYCRATGKPCVLLRSSGLASLVVEAAGCYRISPTQPVNQSCTSNFNLREKWAKRLLCIFSQPERMRLSQPQHNPTGSDSHAYHIVYPACHSPLLRLSRVRFP